MLKSVAIGYQRRVPAFDEQGQCSRRSPKTSTRTPSSKTAPIARRSPAEVKTYELTAPALTGAHALGFCQGRRHRGVLRARSPTRRSPTAGQTQKRLIEQERTALPAKRSLSALLPLGQVESHGAARRELQARVDPGPARRFSNQGIARRTDGDPHRPEGGYRDLDGDGRFWIPSGQAFYSPDARRSGAAGTRLRAGAFLPARIASRIPSANKTIVAYDGKYNLLLVSTRDAVGNETTAEPDYRVLQPKMVTDPNGNRAEARFDALGMLAGTALRGKATGPVGGRFLRQLHDRPRARANQGRSSMPTIPARSPSTISGTATTRILYDLERVPACAASIARETHVSDLAPGQRTRVQLHFVYSDGFGREAQTKVQAEPGPLDLGDPSSPVANPRWVGTGAKSTTTKASRSGNTSRSSAPTPHFGIEKWGVSSTLFYDPVLRVVATLHPNNTLRKSGLRSVEADHLRRQ